MVIIYIWWIQIYLRDNIHLASHPYLRWILGINIVHSKMKNLFIVYSMWYNSSGSSWWEEILYHNSLIFDPTLILCENVRIVSELAISWPDCSVIQRWFFFKSENDEKKWIYFYQSELDRPKSEIKKSYSHLCFHLPRYQLKILSFFPSDWTTSIHTIFVYVIYTLNHVTIMFYQVLD